MYRTVVVSIMLAAAGALAPAAQSSLAYRFLHVDAGIGNPAEGPSAEPARVAQVIDRFREKVARAHRLGYNHLLVPNLENYVPADDPVFGPRAERFRPYLEGMLRAAHERGLKLVLYGDEAVYVPAWLERAGARASVKDPRFWEMLAEKYRRLLSAFPELDGVAARVGEVIPYRGFEAVDLLHSRETEPDPRLEERMRRFVLTAHRVVSGEFGKLFLVRTWTTSDWQTHSVPAVCRGVFTAEVPVANLLVSIKLTKQDAWYYGSAFNPTFGQTPHATIAEAELYSQYHGYGTLVDFPIRWFAAALRYAERRGVRGVMAGEARAGLLGEGMLSVFSRLVENPAADEAQLTREWAAGEFGEAAADTIAEILLASSGAVREVFYLPAFPALGWNPLPHARVHEIVVRGDPFWDEGRGHDEFLRELYLMSRPYLEETREGVARGHRRYADLAGKFAAVADRIERQDRREQFARLLGHGTALAALLRDYVHTFLSYFAYRDRPSPEGRERLASDLAALKRSVEQYRRDYRFYRLAGVDITVKLAERMLEDRPRAEQILRQAPTREQLLARFESARREHERRLAGDPAAEKILRFRGTLDSRAVIRIRGSHVEVENLAGDGMLEHAVEFSQPVAPRPAGGWLLRPVRARGVVYLMEEPSAANRATASIFVDDPEPGNSVYEFELYWSGAPLRPAGAPPPSQSR